MKELLEAFLNSKLESLTVTGKLEGGIEITETWNRGSAILELGHLIDKQRKIELELQRIQERKKELAFFQLQMELLSVARSTLTESSAESLTPANKIIKAFEEAKSLI